MPLDLVLSLTLVGRLFCVWIEQSIAMNSHGSFDDKAVTLSSEKRSMLSDDHFKEREKWGSKFEFILACVGYSVAFGNLLRFPYLCVRNGGGAFLVPYFFFLVFCGIPLYYIEVCLGQFSGSSPLFVWRLAPLFKGLGWLMVLISGIVSWYYNTIIAWVLYYLVNSFHTVLPWSTCNNEWNTENCASFTPFTLSNVTANPDNFNQTIDNVTNAENKTFQMTVGKVSPAKEFWQYNVLRMSKTMEDMGQVQFHLAFCLLGAWILVFLCLCKGIKTIGKVVYVTALLPYVLLVVLLVRGLTLPGSMDGILFYVTPDFSKLLMAQVWLEAAVQVFYSLGPTWGGVITMASFNKFHNNCLRDTLIATLADGFTSVFAGFVVFSIIGFMAHELQQPIEEVATSGPGLMFIAYPEAISRLPLPQLWAALFFIMLIAVGLDTQFGMFETLASGVVDAFPDKLHKRKTIVTAVLACIFFLCGLPFAMNGGIYIFQLVDWYSSALCLPLGAFLELFVVGWIYGADRFSQDIKLMLGYSIPIPARLCCCLLAPAALLVTFLVILVRYEDVVYEDYIYPKYSRVLGLILALIPVTPLFVVAIWEILKGTGSLCQRITRLTQPEDTWKPNERKFVDMYEGYYKDRSKGFLEYIQLTLLGRLCNQPNVPVKTNKYTHKDTVI